MRSGAAENSTRWRTTALPGNCLRFSDGLIPVLTFIYSWWFNQMLDFHCCQTAPPPPAAATQTSLYLNLSTALEDKRSPPPKNHSLFPTPYRLLQCQIYVVSGARDVLRFMLLWTKKGTCGKPLDAVQAVLSRQQDQPWKCQNLMNLSLYLSVALWKQRGKRKKSGNDPATFAVARA